MATYRAFISYSTDPDYRLARETEAFLESFHKRVEELPDGRKPEQLAICRDGSDFSLASLREEAEEAADPEDQIRRKIKEYLADSEYLILFCSRNAAKSAYVDFEAEWFLRNRPDKILFVLTEKDASEQSLDVYPPSIRGASLARSIYFDFRGKRSRLAGPKVRDFEDARVNLASHLYGFTEGQVLPLWLREERSRARRTSTIVGAAALLLLVLFVAAAFLYVETQAQNRTLRSDLLYRQSRETLDDDVVAAIRLSLQAIHEQPSAHAMGQLLASLNAIDNVERIIDAHPGRANAVAFSADGSRFYSIGTQFELAVWEARSYSKGSEFTVPNRGVGSVRQSSGANAIPYMGATDLVVTSAGIVVSGANGEIVLLVDEADGPPRIVQQLHQDAAVLSLAAITEAVFAGGDDGTITRYRIADGALVRDASFEAHGGPVYDLSVSTTHIASGSGDGSAAVWRLEDFERVAHISSEHGGPYYAVEFDPRDGNRVALGGNHAKVQLLELSGEAVTLLTDEITDRVQCLAFHPSGLLLAACGDNDIVLIDVPRKTAIATLPGHTLPNDYFFSFQQVAAARFSASGELLFTLGNDGRLFVRDFELYSFGSDFFNITQPVERPAIAALVHAFDRDLELADELGAGQLLLHDLRQLLRYDLASESLKLLYELPPDAEISAVHVRPEGIVVGQNDGTLLLVDRNGGEAAVVEGHTGDVCCIDDLPEPAKGVVSASTAGELKRWDLSDWSQPKGQRVASLDGQIYGLSVAPNGQEVLVGTDGVYELVRQALVGGSIAPVPDAVDYPVSHVAFGIGRKGFVGGTSGGEINFWENGASENPVAPQQRGHEFAMRALAVFQPSDLVVSMDERDLCFWKASSAELIGCIPGQYTSDRFVIDESESTLYLLGSHRFLYRLPLDPGRWASTAEGIIEGAPGR